MKYKLLISLLLASVVLSCRQNPVEPERQKEPTRVEFGVKSYTPGTATPSEVFSEGDRIGIYVINTASATTNNFNYSNIGYVCNPTNWRAIESGDAILWSEGDENIDFYGYHPFVGDGTGSVKSVTATSEDVEIVYELPLDQTNIITAAERRTFDILHVATKDIAYAGSQPIELNFRHMLSRVRFDVKFMKSPAQTILDEKATITKVEIGGSKIASSMSLMLKSAAYTSSNSVGPIICEKSKEYPVVLDYATVEAATIADLLVIPFEPVAGENTIKFYVTYTEDGVLKNRVFTSFIAPATSDRDIVFKPNKYNIVTALISLDNNSVQITSTIVDWETSEHIIIPGA